MKGLIIYKTQYGSTFEYAQWLGKELSIPLISLSDVTVDQISDCDFIIIGSYIKVGRIKAGGWIKDHWNHLKDKKVVLFAVCGSYADVKEQNKVLHENLPEEIISKIQYYALPGRLEKDILNFWDKFIVYMGTKFFPDEEVANRMELGFDWVEKSKLDPIIEEAEKYNIGVYE
jgi:menaquinone-dependent protoporphyrinogen IX oxidase